MAVASNADMKDAFYSPLRAQGAESIRSPPRPACASPCKGETNLTKHYCMSNALPVYHHIMQI